MRFVILVPNSLDPVARGRKMPVPDARPSEKIAKLFPQVDPSKDKPKDQKNGGEPAKGTAAKPAQAPTAVAQASPTATAVAKPVPLPEARPNIKPVREMHRHRTYRRYRRGR